MGKKPLVAVHCFGRHLDAVGWEGHMWGTPDGRLGQVPTALLIALKENASLLSFGTGASQRGGVSDAEWTRRYALTHLDELKQYPAFHDMNFGAMRTLLHMAFIEDTSKNTVEEINRVFAEYAKRGVTKVFAVTNPSHGPRCRRDLDVYAQDQDLRRHTFLVTSDVPYADAAIGDTVVLEPPHRGDDRAPPFYRLVSRIFKLAPDSKLDFCKRLDALLQEFKV